MIIDFAAPPKVRREPYLEYEFQADLATGAKVLFNDPTLSYNHLVSLEINNKLLRFQLVGAQPTMTIPGDDFLVYPSVLPNVDLAYELYAGRLKEILIINSNQAQHEFSFLLETNEVTASLQPDNSIVYKDADGKTVWTIEAPYATDANGSDVPVTMQFDGAQYTVKALPTKDTVYPIKLDPTVTLPSAYIWNVQGVAQDAAPTPYRLTIGREDGAPVITSLTVYNQRKYGSTYYTTTNSTTVSTKYQFFDKGNVAVSEQCDLVVDASTYMGTITIPAGAYAIEFTGVVEGNASYLVTNVLQMRTAECIDTSSHWDFTQKPLPYYATTAVKFSIPKEKFNNTTSGTNVSETYDAPFGTTFTPGTLGVAHERSSVAYLNSCYVDLYKSDGTLYSSTYIPKPSTAGSSLVALTFRSTSVTVPEGIARITLRGNLYSGSASFSWPKVYFNAPTTVPEYGTAKYAITLAEDIQNAKISPGFDKTVPTAPYKTYVSYDGDIPANYAETTTVTAAAGTTIYIKVSLTANESAAVTRCSNICLLSGATSTVVALLLDSVRRLTQSTDTTTDSLRQLLSGESLENDTVRTTTSSQAINVDSVLHTQVSTMPSADTRRTLTATELITAAMDTLRNIVVNHTAAAETKRKTISFMMIASDSKRRVQNSILAATDVVRRTLNRFMVASDSKRSIQQTVQAGCDTKRSAKINIQAAADTVRRKLISLIFTFDSQRRVKKRIPFWCDTKRNSVANSKADAETKRCLTINQQCTSDTNRSTTTTILIESDTRRTVIEALAEIIQLDTKRRILNSITSKSDLTRCILSATLAAVNTKRRLTVQQALRNDSKRKVTESAQVITKAGRKVTASVLHKLDTNREVTGYIHISYDTERNAREGLCIIYDTKRIIADRTWPRAKQCTLNIQIQGKHITIISFKD